MEAHTRRALVLILALAFGLRVGAGWWWQQRLGAEHRFAFGDSQSYWTLAAAIARGGPYEYGTGGARVFRTPGYPLLLAPFFLIREDPPVWWARTLGAALGTVAVGGVCWLARRWFNDRTALVAGIVAAVDPEAIAASILVLSEAPYTPLLIWQLVLWSQAAKAPSGKSLAVSSILAGVVHGMATLMRPSHLLFLPFTWLLTAFALRSRRLLVIGVWMTVASAATMAPWWWRNYQVTGRFVATTLQFGASLYDGWSPAATGASDMRFVDRFVAAQQQEDAALGKTEEAFEERLDRRLREAAWEWARSHPRQVLALAGIKFRRMWSPVPNAADMSQPWLRVAIAISLLPIVLLAGYGTVLALAGRSGLSSWDLLLCWAPAIYLTAIHMIFVGSLRYREPALLPLIVLAASTIGTGPGRRPAVSVGSPSSSVGKSSSSRSS